MMTIASRSDLTRDAKNLRTKTIAGQRLYRNLDKETFSK